MIRFKNSLRAPLLTVSLATALLLGACGGSDGDGSADLSPVKTFEQSAAPDKLSAWNFVVSDGKTLKLNASAVPYDLNSALFSDYAFKLRAVYVPQGKQVGYRADGTLDFPVGTAIAKTFYYPKAIGTDAAYTGVARRHQDEQGDAVDLATHVVVETRILFRQSDSTWTGLPYVWDADQKDATLKIGGATAKLELVPGSGATEKFDYGVPNAQQCQKCHSTENAGGKGILPIGPKARNLNKSYAYSATDSVNQLEHWNSLKLLSAYPGLASAPANADWTDATQTLQARAKAYLDVNCAHCHNPGGNAQQSGLMLDHATVGSATAPEQWGVCKKPLAYGGPGAPYRYGIEAGKADESLLLYRMAHTGTADVMPAIGRKVNHDEALVMVRDWINQLTLPACP
jgi:uncharacterized repeat protein (TIGR03806 family)